MCDMMVEGIVFDWSIECCLLSILFMEKGVIEELIFGEDFWGFLFLDVIELGEWDFFLFFFWEGGYFFESIEFMLNLSICFWVGGDDDDDVIVDDFGDGCDDDIFCGVFFVWEFEFVFEFVGFSLLKVELELVDSVMGCILVGEICFIVLVIVFVI